MPPRRICFYPPVVKLKSVQWIDPFPEFEIASNRLSHEDLENLKMDRSTERI